MNSRPQDIAPAVVLPDKIQNNRKTIGYYAAIFALGLSASVVGPTLPALAAHTHTDLEAISFLFIARSIAYLLSSLQSGRWYDRLLGHNVLVAGLLVLALSMVLTPLMPFLWALTIVALVLGFADAMVDLGGNTMLLWVHRDKAGPFMNGMHFFFGFGSLLAPVIVAQSIALSHDVVWAYWVLALLMLPGAFWLSRLSSPLAPATVVEEVSTQRDNRVLLLMIALFIALYVGAEIGYGGWIYSYAVNLNLSDATNAAYLTSAFWGALAVGRIVAIPLAARLRPSTIVISDLAGCLISVAIMLLNPHSIVAIWIGTIGLGFSMASIFPTMLVFTERRMVMTGRVTSWFLIGASIGGLSLPWLVGQLFESVGPQVLLGGVLINLLIAMGIFGLIKRFSDKRASLPT